LDVLLSLTQLRRLTSALNQFGAKGDVLLGIERGCSRKIKMRISYSWVE
jgi:hypothetical protein